RWAGAKKLHNGLKSCDPSDEADCEESSTRTKSLVKWVGTTVTAYLRSGWQATRGLGKLFHVTGLRLERKPPSKCKKKYRTQPFYFSTKVRIVNRGIYRVF